MQDLKTDYKDNGKDTFLPWSKQTEKRRWNPTEKTKNNINNSKTYKTTTPMNGIESLNATQGMKSCEDEHEAETE